MAELLRRGLVGLGHTVDVALDGVKALDKEANLPFDTVLLDIMLPWMAYMSPGVSALPGFGCPS